MFNRRPRWGLSWLGWVCLLFLGGLAGLTLALRVHAFFAVTERVETGFLAVEGWVHEYAIQVAMEEFKRGSYDRVFATGGPLHGMGGYLDESNTAASVGATRLKAAGVPEALIYRVPSGLHDRDRTFGAAVALKRWLHANQVPVKAINVLTMDVHARRTRLLFQKAFGDEVVIGIISVPNPDYDAERWWRYSQGVRSVVGESVAYMYAKFLFRPDELAFADKGKTRHAGKSWNAPARAAAGRVS